MTVSINSLVFAIIDTGMSSLPDAYSVFFVQSPVDRSIMYETLVIELSALFTA